MVIWCQGAGVTSLVGWSLDGVFDEATTRQSSPVHRMGDEDRIRGSDVVGGVEVLAAQARGFLAAECARLMTLMTLLGSEGDTVDGCAMIPDVWMRLLQSAPHTIPRCRSLC